MKTLTRSFSILSALIAGLVLIPAGRVAGQSFATLHSFGALSSVNDTNSDGAYPEAGVILSGNTLYGTTLEGGSSGYGTVFALSTNGASFTNLHSFVYHTDGGYPESGVVSSGNTLYGTAYEGGTSGYGTVYAVGAHGAGFTNLHSFTSTGGGYPFGGVILSGNTLYGTTWEGGTSGYGTVFAVNTNGACFTNLHSFTYRSDGGYPYAGLILSGNTLYGTTWEGGTSGYGTVFAVNTDGTGFATLHSFSATSGGSSSGEEFSEGTNSDGAYPYAKLALAGNTLYGTAFYGGTSGYGTIFAVNTNGTGFTTLQSFDLTNDGGYPEGGLALSGNTLYGTAEEGGSSGYGTIFAINTDGTGFTVYYTFTYSTDGGYPNGDLVFSGNTLYGTAWSGGSSTYGTVYALSTVSLQFTASPTSGSAPLTVNFSSPGVDNFGKAITSWNWNFGDGATSTAQNPSHTYVIPGTYSPSLQAANSTGLQIAESGPSIVVSQSTIVLFTANPTNGLAPLTVSFTSAGADSAGNAINSWNWNFGDGATSAAPNPSHTYTAAGVFFPSLIAGNNAGSTAVGFGPASIAATNVPVYLGLVLNGGFGTGDFTGWTLSGPADNDIDLFVDNGSQSGISPQSGKYLAAGGPVGSLNYLSQTLATSAGAPYLLSLWVNSPDGQSPNEFVVSWNGNTLFDESDLPAFGWTNLQFWVSATGTATVLEIGFRDDPSYLGLDNVSVLPVQPGIGSLRLIGTNLIFNGSNGLAGQTYYVLTSTDVTQSLNKWTPVSTNVLGANGNFAIIVQRPATSGASQQFYILQLQ